MEQLLSTRQVQETLKVDRTTIYRMLKDGRLTGVKVGSQWRFSAAEVQNLLSGRLDGHPQPVADAEEILPWICLQPAQDVFAEMAQIGSVIIEPSGLPLTRMSNACDFCSLILESKAGRKACRQSWRQLAGQGESAPAFTACHAGLQYAVAPITVSGQALAFLVGGQFYASQRDPTEEKRRIENLAERFGLNPAQLLQAAKDIKVLDRHLVDQITKWLSMVAKTFEQISAERAEMLSRLRQISIMSQLGPQNLERSLQALDVSPVWKVR